MQSLSPIIQATELLQLKESKDLILIDASTGKDAIVNYQTKHLEGALYVDLNTQLADIKENASNGGRHPLPSPEQFGKTLSSLGISPTSHIVIYDHANAANAAARFWWMLKSAGHVNVQVLNGGFQAAEKVNYPMSSKVELTNQSTSYPINHWQLKTVNIEEVEQATQTNNKLIIDVRDANRYAGLNEPIDLTAGHIPTAINVPYTDNLDIEGLFLSPSLLRKKYQTVFGKSPSENIIVHCGSGVTACHTILAIAYAELAIPNLYVGSWSEWSRNNKDMVTN